MDPNPKSSKFKFAFTGTNSSGKTTLTLDIGARLKFQHVLAEVVSSQDRKVCWKDDHMPVDYRGHFGLMSGLIRAEVEAELKGDADVVIVDRAAIDLYSIAVTDHPGCPQVVHGLRPMVEQWMTSYTKVYYLPPLEYQDDGKRPPNEFRMKTHASLLNIMETWDLPNLVVGMPREEIFKDIQKTMGIYNPNAMLQEDEKWNYLANKYKRTLAVKQNVRRASSDYDVFIVGGKIGVPEGLAQDITLAFGQQSDVTWQPENKFPFEVRIYQGE